MALLATDPNTRYRFRPKKKTDDPRFIPVLPTAKTPEKVAVPVPVPVPRETSGPPRYKFSAPTMNLTTGQVNPPSRVDPAKNHLFDLSGTQSLPASPTGLQTDTATPPEAPAEPAEPESPALSLLRQREAELSAAEHDPVKKEKWYKSLLKMLAYGAKDMPPARDWQEFAYGAGRTLGAGGVGLVDRRAPGKIAQRYKIARAQENVESAQKTAQAESQIQSRADMSKVRNARLRRDLSLDEQKTEDKKRKAVADDLKRLPYIDPSDPIHAKILARAKASGIDVDPESFGKGKNRPRIRVLDDDGVTVHWFEKDPAQGWVPIKIEGRNAMAGMTDKRNPLTGESYSSEQRREFAKQKFDWQKVEAQIDNNRAERALALQKQGVDIRVAQGQGEMEAIDEVLPGLESDYIEQSGPNGDDYLAAQIQRAIATLKDRRGRASGAAGVGAAASKTFKYTEADVRARAKASGKDPEAAVKAARDNKLIP